MQIDPESLPPPRSRDALATTTVWLVAAIVMFVLAILLIQARV